jgi:hypothetical protein
MFSGPSFIGEAIGERQPAIWRGERSRKNERDRLLADSALSFFFPCCPRLL